MRRCRCCCCHPAYPMTHTYTRTQSRVCGVFISIYRCISPTMHTNDLFIYLLLADANDASFSMTQLPHVVALPAPILLSSQSNLLPKYTHIHTRIRIPLSAHTSFSSSCSSVQIYWTFVAGHTHNKNIKQFVNCDISHTVRTRIPCTDSTVWCSICCLNSSTRLPRKFTFVE